MNILRDRYLMVLSTVTLILIAGMAISRHKFPPEKEFQPASVLLPLLNKGPFRVARVVDGDTVVLSNGEIIRLIGVNTPELQHSEMPAQRFSREAAEFLHSLVNGCECTLECEPEDLRDKYDRLLAYVFVKGKLVNAEIIRCGYGYVYTRFPFRRQKEFLLLEQEAQKHQRGLWKGGGK